MAIFSLAAALLAAPDAHAGFALCNQTLDVANIAIARGGEGEAAGSLVSSGWWVVPPNRCADIVPGALRNRYLYVHASDVKGRSLLQGETRLCVGSVKFEIAGGTDCWRRGHKEGQFAEVDTGDSKDWTLFLREPR